MNFNNFLINLSGPWFRCFRNMRQKLTYFPHLIVSSRGELGSVEISHFEIDDMNTSLSFVKEHKTAGNAATHLSPRCPSHFAAATLPALIHSVKMTTKSTFHTALLTGANFLLSYKTICTILYNARLTT